MHTIDVMKGYYVIAYKIRKEEDFWVAYFPDIGRYYATNEIGKDILRYFEIVPQKSLFEYLTELYGELTDIQKQEIEEYVCKLKETSILERRNQNEKI